MKLFAVILCAFIAMPSWAEDATVSERATCDEIQAQIAELSGVAEPDESVTQEIAELKSEYRRNCTRSAGARRTSAGVRASASTDAVAQPDEEAVAPTPEAIEETVDVQDADTEIVTEPAETVLTTEQELANLDAGLCADGSQPNKYGCCGDEIFKDLGDTVFACCPRDSGGADIECFPPIK